MNAPRAAAALVLAALLAAPALRPGAPSARAQLSERVYMPAALSAAVLPDPPTSMPPPASPTATPPDAPSATPEPSAPPSEPPPTATDTPTDEPPTPTPTPKGSSGTIAGRYVSRGEPLAAGFGAPGVPQIELQRLEAGTWTKVANAETVDDGYFAFVDPPALEPGQVYQVWWTNTSLTGYDEWVGRWSSRRVAEFGDGSDVDLGTMEIGNVTLTGPGNDVHFSLPVTYDWTTRDVRDESYRWSLLRDPTCDENRREDPSLYRTGPLGRVGKYTLSSPPPGFRMETLYCWYVFIDAGTQGTGWSFEGWKTKWLIADLLGLPGR